MSLCNLSVIQVGVRRLQLVHAPHRVRVLVSEHSLPDLQACLEYFDCFIRTSQADVRPRQTVHTPQRVGVLVSEHSLPDLQACLELLSESASFDVPG